MCTYNIEIEDSIVSRIRPAFKDDSAIKAWMQEQVVMLMMQYDSTRCDENKKLQDRKSALDFIKSLAVPGGEKVPAEISEVDCLISEKYA